MQKPGLGQRLVARIKAMGYDDPESKFGIKVTEFALDHRYPPSHIYKWIGDVVVPDYETIIRLAHDLEVSPGWLHYGDEALAPKAPRRQGRRTTASLLLTLTLGAASALGWPSAIGSVSAAPRTPPVVQVREKVVPYQTPRRRIFRWLARPLLALTQCPA